MRVKKCSKINPASLKASASEDDNERRLNVSVAGGQSGKTRTVVLTVPKGL